MPVKAGRKTKPLRKTTSVKQQKLTYAERWDLSHLAKEPVKKFDSLLAEIETKVAQFEAARTQLSPAMATSSFHPLLTLSEEIAAASSRLSA